VACEVLSCGVAAVIIVILRSVSHHEVSVFPLNVFLLSKKQNPCILSFSLVLKAHTNSTEFHDVLPP
jgi:hypothetical protein